MHGFPRTNAFNHLVGRVVLRLWGWKTEADWPQTRKAVMIAAPHTSNWDFPLLMFSAWALGLRIRWLGKHTLFEGAFGWFFRALGGIAVDRSAPGGLVEQLADLFRREEALLLLIPAEGTRSRRDHWKSGFYRVAEAAGVPVVCSFLDFPRKTSGFGGSFEPSGDLRADMDHVRAFYAPIRGKHPENESTIYLREEEATTRESP